LGTSTKYYVEQFSELFYEENKMFLAIILLIIGFIVLIKGAEFLVDGSSSLAKKMSISQLAIGLTIVAFGTSAPELIVNLIASFKGHDAIAFGNIIGSNIFNVLVVLGVACLITQIKVQKNTVLKEIPILLIATIFVFCLCNNCGFSGSSLSRFDGIILISGLLLFFYYVSRISKTRELEVDVKIFSNQRTPIYIILGIIGLFIGGELVVHNAVIIARLLGVSDKFIALTIVALGTSLPELVTSVLAVIKKHNDLAIGNVVGSNIFNLLLVLGLSSIIHPLEYNPELNIDFFLLILITIILFFTFIVGKRRIMARNEAIFFLILYAGYLLFIFNRK